MPRTEQLQRPCATQHFGTWLADSQWMRRAIDAINAGHWQPSNEPPELLSYDVADGVATIQITDYLTKRPSSFGGVSYLAVAACVRKADADPGVQDVVLLIDSPGGTVSGVEHAAAAIKRCETRITAVIQDMCCSAAMWLASQCDRILTHETATVGCIGTYCVLADTSKAYAEAGYKLTLVTSGGVKGHGADGVVTEELLAEAQRSIDEITKTFVTAVAAGRGMAEADIRALATGETWHGADAVARGLADAIVPADDYLTTLQQLNEQDLLMPMTEDEFAAAAAENPNWLESAAKPQIEQAESAAAARATEAAQPQPATRQELRNAFPGESDFVLDQLDTDATLQSAKLAYAEKQGDKLKALRDENAQLKADAAKHDPGSAGTTPVALVDPDTGHDGDKQMSEERRSKLGAHLRVKASK